MHFYNFEAIFELFPAYASWLGLGWQLAHFFWPHLLINHREFFDFSTTGHAQLISGLFITEDLAIIKFPSASDHDTLPQAS